MFNPLGYHLILDPYISSNSRQRKHTTHIWIKITWHYSALWFFYYLDYVAKTRQANVSRNKRKKKVDGMAAVIILQGYLDRNREG